jgi:hypothetical protein
MPVLYFISCDLWTYVTFGRAVNIRAAMEAVSGFLLGALAARGCMNFYIARVKRRGRHVLLVPKK